jgi:hypothetical protein
MTLFAITNYHWPICWMICFILLLHCHFHTGFTTGNPVYLIIFRLRVGFTGQQRIRTLPRHLILHCTFAFVGGPCCPTLNFVYCLLDYDCVLHIVNFAILYSKVQLLHVHEKMKYIKHVNLGPICIIDAYFAVHINWLWKELSSESDGSKYGKLQCKTNYS